MQIRTKPLQTVAGVTVSIDSDTLNAENAKEFLAGLLPLVEQNPLLIIDMQALKFVDSAGLGALLSCLRGMEKRQGQLKLVGLGEKVRALLELVRLNRIFSIHETEAEALASL
jgi:anti-sigma B factor antagonist